MWKKFGIAMENGVKRLTVYFILSVLLFAIAIELFPV